MQVWGKEGQGGGAPSGLLPTSGPGGPASQAAGSLEDNHV